MIAHADGAADVRPWRCPLQVGVAVVGFISVDVIDLSAFFTATNDKRLSDDSVVTNLSFAAAITQGDVAVSVSIHGSENVPLSPGIINAPVRRNPVVLEARNWDKLCFHDKRLCSVPSLPSTVKLSTISLREKSCLGDRLAWTFLCSRAEVCVLSKIRPSNPLRLAGPSPKGGDGISGQVLLFAFVVLVAFRARLQALNRSLVRLDQMSMTACRKVRTSPEWLAAHCQNRSRAKNEFCPTSRTRQAVFWAISSPNLARKQIVVAIKTKNLFLCFYLCNELLRDIQSRMPFCFVAAQKSFLNLVCRSEFNQPIHRQSLPVLFCILRLEYFIGALKKGAIPCVGNESHAIHHGLLFQKVH